ncbi:MAG: hypothetical protein VZR27_11060, partial [Acutalibacteraceae bacterium]|nr:hypothetical protein [Acutalibacteraceae bacterium]
VVSSDGNITAYGKINTIPDSIIFADWSSLFDKKWDYRAESAKDINDCAAALVWNNQIISSKETNEYSVYYGVKNKSAETPPENSEISEISEISEVSKITENSQVSEHSEVSHKGESIFTGDNGNILASAFIAFAAALTAVLFTSKRKRGGKHD